MKRFGKKRERTTHPAWIETVTDLKKLDIHVKENFFQKATPYAVVNGRSNARWWLVPLTSSKTTRSGLRMFQPALLEARLVKHALSTLSYMGLAKIWAKEIIYIRDKSSISSYFSNSNNATCAYYTGTNGPHRKLTIQIMDQYGESLGYAKATTNPDVRRLFEHEVVTLHLINKLDLTIGSAPKVVFFGPIDDCTLLVTSTAHRSGFSTSARLLHMQNQFLQELEDKTSKGHTVTTGEIAYIYRKKNESLVKTINHEWLSTIEKTLQWLEKNNTVTFQTCMSHGDFTSWNTMVCGKKLHVFDWEYADSTLPKGLDRVHLVLSNPALQKKTENEQLAILKKTFSIGSVYSESSTFSALVRVYLLLIFFRLIARCNTNEELDQAYSDLKVLARLIDHLP